MVSVLSKIFGFSKIDLIEDIVQETFMVAFQSWKLQGFPENPTAWLYRVARNKLLNEVHRQKIWESKWNTQVSNFLEIQSFEQRWEEELSIPSDNQMRLLFMVCCPILPEDSQIALALKVVSGFTAEEIAKVFLSNRDSIQKKISRAKQKLIDEQVDLSLGDTLSHSERIPFVLKALYLIFTEGYHSLSNDKILRKDLCFESLRLALILIEKKETNTPEGNALVSLMCFHVSRFESRVSDGGTLVPFFDQDEGKWNQDLVHRGYYFLEKARTSMSKSDYLLEAMIASLHTRKDSIEKWKALYILYNDLYRITNNPIVAMNRAYVQSKLSSDLSHQKQIIDELLDLKELQKNHLYHLILAKLYLPISKQSSDLHFHVCLENCSNPTERDMIQKIFLNS
jgi:RNA polymerase sigma factor (sigma-70 family)